MTIKQRTILPTLALTLPLLLGLNSGVAWAGCNHNNPDPDGDGICNSADNCDFIPNAGQQNSDSDSLGDACDNCPTVANPTQQNSDTDSLGDACDNCQTVANPAQENGDGDAYGNVCDNCPAAPNSNQQNSDADALGDACDNCPTAANPAQENADGDVYGNVCDNCPTVTNTGQEDQDQDLIGDVCDDWTICAPDEFGPGRVPRATYLPSPDYITSTAPAKGAMFNDTALGCSFKRLTDGMNDPDPQRRGQVSHEYSSVQAFNSNGTLLLVARGGIGSIGNEVIDLNGNIARTNLAAAGVDEPRWSTTDPDVFYYHNVAGGGFYRYRVSTGVGTLLYTLPDALNPYDNIDFGIGEGDVSQDGNHIVVIGKRTSPPVTEIRLLRISDGQIGDSITNGAAPATVTACDVTPTSNNILCDFSSGGYQLFKGFRGTYLGNLYESGKWIRTITTAGVGHSDRARDANGDEVFVRIKYSIPPDPVLGGCPAQGIEKVNIATSQRTCILPLPYTNTGPGAMHISVNNVSGHPWALVSSYDANWGTRDFNLPVNSACQTSCSASPDCANRLSPNRHWSCLWDPWINELFLLKLDGSQVHRMAHHRARQDPDDPAVANCSCSTGCPSPAVCPTAPGCTGSDTVDTYWSTPRASISNDGRRVIFDSNFAQQPCLRYNDVYLLETEVQEPNCPLCSETYCTGVDVGCHATGACVPGVCCFYECGVSMPGCTESQCPPNVCGGCGGF